MNGHHIGVGSSGCSQKHEQKASAQSNGTTVTMNGRYEGTEVHQSASRGQLRREFGHPYSRWVARGSMRGVTQQVCLRVCFPFCVLTQPLEVALLELELASRFTDHHETIARHRPYASAPFPRV
eukprot:364174-Pelagomonas_calceolata.AAC.1